MLTLKELKALAKQNKIHYTCKNEDEIAKLLIDNNIITISDINKPKPVKQDVSQSIRNNP